jgi:hypothetical protein
MFTLSVVKHLLVKESLLKLLTPLLAGNQITYLCKLCTGKWSSLFIEIFWVHVSTVIVF